MQTKLLELPQSAPQTHAVSLMKHQERADALANLPARARWHRTPGLSVLVIEGQARNPDAAGRQRSERRAHLSQMPPPKRSLC